MFVMMAKHFNYINNIKIIWTCYIGIVAKLFKAIVICYFFANFDFGIDLPANN